MTFSLGVRVLLCVAAIFSLLICIDSPAYALDQPWCITKPYSDGYNDCRYATLQQCLADRVGSGGSCGLNPYPTAPEPRSRSSRRS
jgi:Protein of unknown function (DUF3551)